MQIRPFRLATWTTVAAVLVLMSAAPASAQYQPRPLHDPATGESYRIEAAGDFWMPTADVVVSSESLGIPGSEISLKRDLGVTDQRFRALQLTLRPARSHKFRLQYVPIKYTASTTLSQDVVFNGIRYRLGVPVNSLLDWKAFRFGYEYDFVNRNRGYAGVILEAKYTDVQVRLDSPFASEFARARGPIPAIGGVGRVYLVPNISITGEVTGFKWPERIDDRYKAHYIDMDFYGTVNFTDNIGVKGGFRSTDVGYLFETDRGTLNLRGLYFGAVLRY